MLARSVPAALALATLSKAQDPNYFITFGDSYSQTGFEITGEKPSAANPLGNPPLPGWTASGGLDWVGFMVTEFNASLTYSYNFAFGGATVDASIVPPYDPATVLSLIDQVQLFSDNLAAKPDYAPWTPENTVAGVWMGVNDVGSSWYAENSTEINAAVVGAYFEQLQILYDAGIRQLVLLNVPPTDKTPLMADTGEQLVTAISNFNELIESSLEDFTTANTGITAKLVDTHLPFNTAIDDPEEYGAPDATCYNEDGVSCLWFNDYHPAVAIQRLVGAQVAQVWGNGFFGCVDSAMCES